MRQSKATLILEDVFIAGPGKMFLALNADGSVNWENTRGVMTVYSNKTYVKAGETKEQKDRFQLHLKGESMLQTFGTFCCTGKGLEKVVCAVGTEQIKLAKTDGKGEPILEDVPRLYVMEYKLGDDSKTEKERQLKERLHKLQMEGEIRPDQSIDNLTLDKLFPLDRGKSRQFDINEARRTAMFGNFSLWSKTEGNWKPNANAQAQVQANTFTVTAPNGMSINFPIGTAPEVVSAAMKAFGIQEEAPKMEQVGSAANPENFGHAGTGDDIPF